MGDCARERYGIEKEQLSRRPISHMTFARNNYDDYDYYNYYYYCYYCYYL